ncbi:MAG: penicillin-binding protein 2, partial [Parcubacteria group bacterium Gr01-1014_49]
MMWRRKKRWDSEIAPDEIFLDSSNAPAFDRARFEGRLEKPLPQSAFLSLAGMLTLFFLVLITRAWNLQVTHGADFAAESARNSLEARTLFAPRGIIIDVNGATVAENIEKEDGSVRRNYPVPALGQIIGYVSYPKKDAKGIYYDTKQTGLTGLEAQYDALLAGRNGQLLTETDALGKVRSEGVVVPAESGKTIQLSIDANLQKLFARALGAIVEDKHFIAGAGVIMDVHTGAVRAMVSYPSFDPNVMASGGPSKIIAGYSKDPGRPFLDHAVQGVYAPGSIVKPLMASGALTDGLITQNTVIDDPGFLSLPYPYPPGKSFIYKGWKALGIVDVRKAIAWSSDIFFYT